MGKIETAVFAGGCFWCTEAIFKELKGVKSAIPGYSGGNVKNPTYEEVSTGETGHAEATKIEYEPEEISYNDLLTVFFATHDPTSLNRQGNDVGPQYRSAVFYMNEGQKKEAEEFIKKIDTDKSHPVVTEVIPFKEFHIAEDYHKNYYEHHKNELYCQLVISPKLGKLKSHFQSLLKK